MPRSYPAIRAVSYVVVSMLTHHLPACLHPVPGEWIVKIETDPIPETDVLGAGLCNTSNLGEFLFFQCLRNFQRDINLFHKSIHNTSGAGQFESVEQE